MSDDLVKRARELAGRGGYYSEEWGQMADRIEQLEAALRTLIASCDSGIRMQKIGISGMSVQTNIQSSWVHNVEAWAVHEARAALAGEKKNG